MLQIPCPVATRLFSRQLGVFIVQTTRPCWIFLSPWASESPKRLDVCWFNAVYRVNAYDVACYVARPLRSSPRATKVWAKMDLLGEVSTVKFRCSKLTSVSLWFPARQAIHLWATGSWKVLRLVGFFVRMARCGDLRGRWRKQIHSATKPHNKNNNFVCCIPNVTKGSFTFTMELEFFFCRDAEHFSGSCNLWAIRAFFETWNIFLWLSYEASIIFCLKQVQNILRWHRYGWKF